MLDSTDVRHEEVTTVKRTELAVVVGLLTTSTDMGTHAYVLHSLLGEACPVVEAILPLVNWIDRNRMVWVWIKAEQEATTQFAHDMLWIVSAYLNACILASTASVEGDLGARIPVSFQYLINELDHGGYTGRKLPWSLHDLLTVRAGRYVALAAGAAQLPPVPHTIDVVGRSGGGCGSGVIVSRGWRWNDHSGEVIPNPLPIQCICILSG